MKEFLFISDFDGTLTDMDFYQIIVDRYLGDDGRKLCETWKQGDLTLFEFLEIVFKSINRDEAEILKTVYEIPFDPYVKTFIDHIKASGIDFMILSAGTGYYIENLFAHLGIKDVPVIANRGVYKDGGVHMLRDRESPFYSEETGIDKSIAVQKFKHEYRTVFYAGDSQPDLKAAISADLIFARRALKKLLSERNHSFVPFDSLTEIEEYLISNKLIIPLN